MPRYAELIYNGFWFSPEREMLQAPSTRARNRHRLGAPQALQGQCDRDRPSSPYSLYAKDLVTFEDDQGAYDQKDAEGFIKLNALRLRTLAMRKRKAENNAGRRNLALDASEAREACSELARVLLIAWPAARP